MDARYYNGDYDLPHPSVDDACPDCGVAHNEPCTPECGCRYCRAKELKQGEERLGVSGEVDE